MEDKIVYYIDYEYYDKRHYRKEKHLTCFNKERLNTVYEGLKQKMKDGSIGAPIDLPHVTMQKNNDEIKVISLEEA